MRCPMLREVIKETTITDGPDVSSAAVVAKLEVGDVVELLGEPSEQGEMMRATCRSMRDGSEGWVTLKGNQGSTHLTDGGLLWRVQKDDESFPLPLSSGSSLYSQLDSQWPQRWHRWMAEACSLRSDIASRALIRMAR
eukprot:s497_g43.t1